MKSTRIIFWITTGLVFLMEGVMPAVFFHSEASRQGLGHLQYPMYFGDAMVVFKVLGALALILPMVPARIKEWAYAGLFFDLTSSIYSGIAVSGSFDPMMLGMLAWIVPGILSYYFWNKKKSLEFKVPTRL